MAQLLAKLGFLACLFVIVHGHGMVLDPTNRGSLWRTNPSLPQFYDDDGQNCGGFGDQWVTNKGKCGFCGDSYSKAAPRKFEIGGSFNSGNIIAKSYKPGSVMPIEIMITANHMGYFNFTLCNLDKYEQESEECFSDMQLMTSDGKLKWEIEENRLGLFKFSLQVPEAQCKHCVLQWTWTTANTWGECGKGISRNGCGPQETFRTCSDISILA